MGAIGTLGWEIEEASSLLKDLRESSDKEYHIAVALHTEYTDDVITAIALIHREMASEYRDLDPMDFRWAVDFMDHLTTMDKTIIPLPLVGILSQLNELLGGGQGGNH